MTQVDDTEAILEKARTAIRSASKGRKAIDQDVRRYAARSRRIGTTFRKKIFDKAVALSGIDPADIAKRQADNDEADLAFFEKLHIRTAENAKEVAVRNNRLIDSYKDMKQRLPIPFPPAPVPPAPVTIILDEASGTLDDVAPGVSHNFLISPWSNELKVLIEANQQRSSDAVFLFNWTPPRDGLLNLAAVIAMNGSYWWATQHKCVETLIEQDMSALLYIADARDTTNATLVASQSVFYNYQDDHPGCWTDSGSVIVDQPVFLTASNIPVAAGQPIVIAVGLYFEFFTDEARGQIDFENGDKKINVSSLILHLQ